jgi:hypothetical protein
VFKLLAFAAIAVITIAVVSAEAAEIDRPDADRAAAAVGYAHAATAAPLAQATPPAHVSRRRRTCDRNYRGRCLRPNVRDYDCAGGSGDGPRYVRGPFRVVGYDRFGLDSDGDGVACES